MFYRFDGLPRKMPRRIEDEEENEDEPDKQSQ